ncbi:hypothetical protein RHAB15C_0000228 [Candidatus Rhabdochlamydia porcellionis]|uniref:Uncharacterized protein n=1 Tax=Candidatus Rhabdochlamydia porcellionis TaxID=225148 RepID=A0ABX8YZF6_9BACT|nr:hypothetical protein RHAB15C_0000228 [Candidatus Rhabdochlamydia porcellionis]
MTKRMQILRSTPTPAACREAAKAGSCLNLSSISLQLCVLPLVPAKPIIFCSLRYFLIKVKYALPNVKLWFFSASAISFSNSSKPTQFKSNG